MPCAIFCPIPPTLQLQFHELFYSFSISNPFHESCVTYANSHVACMCIHCIFNCIHVIGQDDKTHSSAIFFSIQSKKIFLLSETCQRYFYLIFFPHFSNTYRRAREYYSTLFTPIHLFTKSRRSLQSRKKKQQKISFRSRKTFFRFPPFFRFFIIKKNQKSWRIKASKTKSFGKRFDLSILCCLCERKIPRGLAAPPIK